MNNIVISIEDQEIADAWLEFHRHLSVGDAYHEIAMTSPHHWAVHKLIDIGMDQPERFWLLILEIFNRSESDWQRANLAAGPLEDLLSCYGEDFIDRIEKLANQNENFRELLTSVWKNTITPVVWNRIQCLCSISKSSE